MVVTDIVEQKNNTHRFSVYVDGEYSFSLTADELVKENIKQGLKLTERQIKTLKKKSGESLLLTHTIEKCLRRPHSEYEIKRYLMTKQAGEKTIEDIIGRCRELSLLDDVAFADYWYRQRLAKGRSRRYITSELRSKRVDPSIIEAVVLGDDDDSLRLTIAKKQGKYSNQQKLIAYLQRQGFAYGDIVAALKDEAD